MMKNEPEYQPKIALLSATPIQNSEKELEEVLKLLK
jgi:hypothetical protein